MTTPHLSDDLPELTPADVRAQRESALGGEGTSDEDLQTDLDADADAPALLFQLLRPRSRADILAALFERPEEPLTAREICDAAGIDPSTFAAQRPALQGVGVVLAAGKKGNAMTYRLNTRHPTVQALQMAVDVTTHGSTSLLFEEQFLNEPLGDRVEAVVADGDFGADPHSEAVAAAVRETDGFGWVTPDHVEPYL